MSRNKKLKQKRSLDNRKRRYFLVFLGVPLLGLVTLVTLELTNTTYIFHKKTIPISASSNTKGEVSQHNQNQRGQTTTAPNNNAGSVNPVTAQTGDNKDNTGGDTLNLLAPSGDFVSAHSVALNTPMTSVCNTTPGANCKITFSDASSVGSLQLETTDRGGSAYWNNWTPRNIGLLPGTWRIQAIVSLNSQTKTASDAKDLVVSP